MSTILVMTPFWVWLILLFLVMRGIKAMRPNSMSLSGMLILPVVFTVWAGLGLSKFGHATVALDVWLVLGLTIGLALGVAIFKGLQGYHYDRHTQHIHRPGSVRMLLISLLAFMSKFAVALYVVRCSLQKTDISPLIYGGVSGMVCGLLWGAIATQIFKALKRRERAIPSPLPELKG
ncbi:DUF6622 family protein [Aquirhabdus sp.]|uniref:DUF6622 family protein n=1 Tax=Aquirhabdus sp. TaxID=2824160 RepID=UPI00396C6BAC